MPKTKRFYHFMRAEHALQAIERRRLKVANLAETNDPYECLSLAFANRCQERRFQNTFQNVQEIQRTLYKIDNKDVDSLKGVVCFSRHFHSPLLWSHYADKFKGICLDFDIEVYDNDKHDILKPVDYVPNRLTNKEFDALIANFIISNSPNIDENVEIGQKSFEQLKRLFFTKSDHWKYENEWRTWTDGQRDSVSGLYFVGFGDRLILREILVGFRCTEKDIKSRLDKLVSHYSEPPKIFSTQRSLFTFEIEKMPFQLNEESLQA